MGAEDRVHDGILDAPELSMCIADAVRDPVLVLAAGFRIRAANQAFLQEFGVDADDLREEPLGGLHGGALERAGLLGHLDRVLSEGRALRGLEIEVDLPDRGPRHLRINASPLPSHPGGLVLSFEDVTETRLLHRNLVQSQKLETVGRLAGGIAHDFNNQLAAIIGFSELAIQSIKWDEGVRVPLMEILKAGQSAASLTQQLLAFSRKRSTPPKPLNVNGVILDWERLLLRILGERIQFRTSYGSSLANVVIDAAQMGQIILNLVVNARDAMPSGGIIRLSTANTVRRPLAQDGAARAPRRPFVMLEIADTGTGIDPESLPRIFEPWFTTKGESRGTGLGLATVRGIVDKVGGEIEVESAAGTGTVFRVYLPAQREDAEIEAG